MRRPPMLRPARARGLDRPFGWLPLRLLTEGHWARLSAPAQPLYAFLALVADRQGVSVYGEARLTTRLPRPPDELRAAPPPPPAGVPEALRVLLARWGREA